MKIWNNIFNKSISPLFLKNSGGFIYFGHGVTGEDINEPFYTDLHLGLSYVERNITFWQNLGFRFISYLELEQIILTGKSPAYPWIHLTFDDGYKNNLTVALPYLKSKNIPFTVYISVANIIKGKPLDVHLVLSLIEVQESKEDFLDIVESHFNSDITAHNENNVKELIISKYKYLTPNKKKIFIDALKENSNGNISQVIKKHPFEEMLSVTDLIELAKSEIVNIGSHGYNHNILTTLTDKEIIFEMRESKKKIEEIINQEVRSYCYPNGTESDFNLKIEEMCYSVGYKTAFTTINTKWDRGNSPFRQPRIPLSRKSLSKKAFKFLIT